MKIAITGATGFIGRHVRNVLVKTNHDVLLVVRKQAKIGELGANEKSMIADISEGHDDWFDHLNRPDVLIHLAWGGLPNYQDRYHVEVGLKLQILFLKGLISTGLPKLVVSGTCYEYGLAGGALVEGQEMSPNTPYGVAKDHLRKFLSGFSGGGGPNFELTWARIFYPYGVGQSATSIYSQLRSAILNGDQQFKMGSGTQLLDFISVERAASVLVSLATYFEAVGIVNVGSGKPQTTLDFVHNQIHKLGAQIVPLVGAIPDRKFESQAFWADISKLKSLNI